jgi:dystonin
MGAVSDLFDRNGEGLIDWQEFIAALRPDWQERKPATDAEKIHDEVKRLVMLCTCRQKFRVFQVGEGKYRVSFFLQNSHYFYKISIILQNSHYF